MTVDYTWRGDFTDVELNILHAEGFDHRVLAARGARAAGCEWLHVDFEPHLRRFYFEACGFKATDAGLIALK